MHRTVTFFSRLYYKYIQKKTEMNTSDEAENGVSTTVSKKTKNKKKQSVLHVKAKGSSPLLTQQSEISSACSTFERLFEPTKLKLSTYCCRSFAK
jgi:hypothetical protein